MAKKNVAQKDKYLEIELFTDSDSGTVLIRRLSEAKHGFLRSVNKSTIVILTELKKVFENDNKTVFHPTIMTTSWHD